MSICMYVCMYVLLWVLRALLGGFRFLKAGHVLLPLAHGRGQVGPRLNYPEVPCAHIRNALALQSSRYR